jgi:hypothetical protein
MVIAARISRDGQRFAPFAFATNDSEMFKFCMMDPDRLRWRASRFATDRLVRKNAPPCNEFTAIGASGRFRSGAGHSNAKRHSLLRRLRPLWAVTCSVPFQPNRPHQHIAVRTGNQLRGCIVCVHDSKVSMLKSQCSSCSLQLLEKRTRARSFLSAEELATGLAPSGDGFRGRPHRAATGCW